MKNQYQQRPPQVWTTVRQQTGEEVPENAEAAAKDGSPTNTRYQVMKEEDSHS